MNWKRGSIFCLSIFLATYQTGIGMPIRAMAAPLDTATLISDKEDGVYQAKIKYEKWMKKYPNCVHPAKEWKKVNGKYQYPVTPYDKEWGSYGKKEERYVACQIPQKILDELSTEELLELVLDCPLTVNMYLYDGIKDGVKKMAQYLNGMDELLGREDCLSVVHQYYAKYNIPEKQQLDYEELLPGNNPDYYTIVDDEKLMRKAEKDANVMIALNLCEAIIEIASDKNIISMEEKQAVAKTILQKEKEKNKSQCVDGPSVEKEQADSILNNCLRAYSGQPVSEIAGNGQKLASTRSGSPYFVLPDGGKVYYTIPNSSRKFTADEISKVLNQYKQFRNIYGDPVITVAGEGGTTAYNCYNYAWLKKYDPQNLWKKCTLNNDEAFRNYRYFTKSSHPGGIGWIGSNARHAVYTIRKSYDYIDGNNRLYSAPLVKSKWGPKGLLVQHPLNRGEYQCETSDMTWFC